MRQGIFSLIFVLANAQSVWAQEGSDPTPVDEAAPAPAAAAQPVESTENTALKATPLSEPAPAATPTLTTPTPAPAAAPTDAPPTTEPVDPAATPKLDPSAFEAAGSEAEEMDGIAPGHRGALLFSFSSLLSGPGSYNGVGLGVRIGVTPSVRMRGGLGFSFLENKTTQFGGTPQSLTAFGFAADAGVEVAVMRVGSIEIYAGGMIQVSYRTTTNGTAASQDSSAVTIAGIVGSNFFIMDALSLGAEYRIGFSYSTVPGRAGDYILEVGVGSVGFILGYWW